MVEKIVNQNCILGDFFPDYKSYKTPEYVTQSYNVPNENPKVLKAKMFILQQFLNITQSGVKPFNPANTREKLLIPYFTCAVNILNMKRVFSGCEKIMRRENMIKLGL